MTVLTEAPAMVAGWPGGAREDTADGGLGAAQLDLKGKQQRTR